MIGKTVSHYKILEKLGGGLGVVYKAEDTKLKRIVALKFLPPELIRDEDAKQRLIQEAQAASTLDHQNICTIYEFGETKPTPGEPGDGQVFIVMAYYDGETVKKKINRGAMQMDEALDLTIQIANGLSKAHEKKIVHRDIKPTNVMVTDDGVAKIVDFGLANTSGGTGLTNDNTIIGTAAYMSPEQTRDEGVDNRTDIWALGVVMYEMLTGQLPFKGDYEQAVFYSILNIEPKPIMELRNDVSPKIARIIVKTLEKEPDARYQGMEELIADIKRGLVYADIEHNLPNPGTRFIGRKEEIKKIKELQAEHRLLTLYGPGGSGKTRLALEVSKITLTHYPDGIFFFDLAPLENPEMVSDTFAQVLRVNKEKDKTLEASIARNIALKNMLLVIDNCEHLVDK